MQEVQSSARHSVKNDAAKYIVLAFGISWIAWILVIKLRLSEGLLYLGSSGPALAAVVLSRGKESSGSQSYAWRRALLFVIALVACWIVICLYFSWRSGFESPVKIDPCLLLPSTCPAWIISGLFSQDSGVRSLIRRLVHVPGVWSLIAFLLFPSMLLAGDLIGYALHKPLIHPSHLDSRSAVMKWAALYFGFNLLFTATNEEPGWRGFLLDRLQNRFSPLVASFLVWVPWALWHGPLDFYRPERFSLVTYLELRGVFLIPLVILMTWLYNRSGGSIQSTALFHASMNTFPFVMPYFPPGFALLFVAAVLVIVGDRMWRRSRSATLDPATMAANPVS
jgi:uncharacterized protein